MNSNVADRESSPQPKVELMLTLRLKNDDRGSDLLRARHGLIASINQYCDPSFVSRLVIVVPASDVTETVQSIGYCAVNVEVISENALLHVDSIGNIPRRGWFIQQLLKLAYANIAKTEYYVTLDADVFMMNRFDSAVFRDGRAPAAIEPANAHAGWWTASAAVLGFGISAFEFDSARAFGVTPAFMKASLVVSTIDRLQTIALAAGGISWIEYLCQKTSLQNDCWTEYSLYWTNLINTVNPWDFYYSYPVYLFSHSVWQVRQITTRLNEPYPQLFGIIQSSYVDEEAYTDFVRAFLASTVPEHAPDEHSPSSNIIPQR